MENVKSDWLIANACQNSSIGYKLSVQNLSIHDALPCMWNEKKGWIKWNVKGYDYKQINKLKDNIIRTLFYLKSNEVFTFSYE